ncbi:MAG: L,D-transpeptidase family protein [Pseudomonadota bacterium]
MHRLLSLAVLGLLALVGARTWGAEQPIVLASADSSRYLPSPDALIGKTLQDIRASRLDDALKEVEKVISIRPDFKLAHLIRGDLLMARAKPLSGLGPVPAGEQSQSLTDLRDEARVRLLRYIDQPDPSHLPRQILQLAPEQKYALLADAGRARLYLFENVNGEPRLLRDYYMTIGRNGTDKRAEGDKKTPVGVYLVSERLSKRKLSDFYGAGAFPLNYPNDWDQAQDRSGHGIWLHGVPSDTYSRPPRSSDGCVVVTNPDLKELSRWVQVGLTPVVIADRADWVERREWEKSREGLMATLEDWKADWEARDTDRLLAHYSSNLAGVGEFQEWQRNKRRNVLDKDWIRVNLRDVSLFLYPGGEMAYSEFTQGYESDKLSNLSRKRVYWHREGGKWRIVLEKALDLPDNTTKLAKR